MGLFATNGIQGTSAHAVQKAANLLEKAEGVRLSDIKLEGVFNGAGLGEISEIKKILNEVKNDPVALASPETPEQAPVKNQPQKIALSEKEAQAQRAGVKDGTKGPAKSSAPVIVQQPGTSTHYTSSRYDPFCDSFCCCICIDTHSHSTTVSSQDEDCCDVECCDIECCDATDSCDVDCCDILDC